MSLRPLVSAWDGVSFPSSNSSNRINLFMFHQTDKYGIAYNQSLNSKRCRSYLGRRIMYGCNYLVQQLLVRWVWSQAEYPAISIFCGPMTGRAPDCQPQQPEVVPCTIYLFFRKTHNDRCLLILRNPIFCVRFSALEWSLLYRVEEVTRFVFATCIHQAHRVSANFFSSHILSGTLFPPEDAFTRLIYRFFPECFQGYRRSTCQPVGAGYICPLLIARAMDSRGKIVPVFSMSFVHVAHMIWLLVITCCLLPQIFTSAFSLTRNDNVCHVFWPFRSTTYAYA